MTDHSSHTDADLIRAKFAAARRDRSVVRIDRDDGINLTYTALVAGESMRLISAPDTAPSR